MAAGAAAAAAELAAGASNAAACAPPLALASAVAAPADPPPSASSSSSSSSSSSFSSWTCFSSGTASSPRSARSLFAASSLTSAETWAEIFICSCSCTLSSTFHVRHSSVAVKVERATAPRIRACSSTAAAVRRDHGCTTPAPSSGTKSMEAPPPGNPASRSAAMSRAASSPSPVAPCGLCGGDSSQARVAARRADLLFADFCCCCFRFDFRVGAPPGVLGAALPPPPPPPAPPPPPPLPLSPLEEPPPLPRGISRTPMHTGSLDPERRRCSDRPRSPACRRRPATAGCRCCCCCARTEERGPRSPPASPRNTTTPSKRPSTSTWRPRSMYAAPPPPLVGMPPSRFSDAQEQHTRCARMRRVPAVVICPPRPFDPAGPP
jgi:hypothetical protein